MLKCDVEDVQLAREGRLLLGVEVRESNRRAP